MARLIQFVCFSLFVFNSSVLFAQDFVARYNVGVGQQYVRFNEIFEVQNATTLFASALRDHGSYTLKVNRAHRFDIVGYQLEAEAYPIFQKGLYGYFAYAWSDSPIFTDHRLGAELFKALPKAFEVSLGGRYLHFKSGTSSHILTGSISKYYKAYLFSVRPFLIFSGGGTGQTLIFSAKRFFNDKGDLIGIRIGGGVSPDQVIFQLSPSEQGARLLLLKSRQIGAEGVYNINQRWKATFSADYNFQELTFRPDDFVQSLILNGSLTYAF